MKFLLINKKVIFLLTFTLILFSCSDDIEKELKEVSWSESNKIEKNEIENIVTKFSNYQYPKYISSNSMNVRNRIENYYIIEHQVD